MSEVVRWVVAAVRAAGWAPIAVFAAHVLSSRVLAWYEAFPPLDIPMHVAGGLAIAFFFWRSLGLPEAKFAVGELTPVASSLLAFASTGTSTVVWEFAEWFSDRYFGTQAQLGLEDTLLDMLLGLLGGLVLVLAMTMRASARSRGGSGGGRPGQAER